MQYLSKYSSLIAISAAFISNKAIADSAESFDNARFSANAEQINMAAAARAGRGAIGTASTFFLDVNGVASPVPQENEENNNGYVNADAISVGLIPSAAIQQIDEDIKLGYVMTPGACPQSSLPPEQIVALVKSSARRHGVAPDFATAVAWVESRFDRVRNSPKGARGPMQLMPGTASNLGVTDICDPPTNIDSAVRYLRSLLDEFQNPLLAAAAYNAGPQAVRDHGGVPPYAETINYLAEILNFQLGLRSRDSRTASHKPEQRPEDSGVIGGVSAGRFVGGVMKF